jgi:hypothetical protein
MDDNPHDPKQPLSRLFGDTGDPDERSGSPFGEAWTGIGTQSRLRGAITRLRILRSQAGSDGLTPSATRSLVDEVVAALEAIRDALLADDSGDEEESQHDP